MIERKPIQATAALTLGVLLSVSMQAAGAADWIESGRCGDSAAAIKASADAWARSLTRAAQDRGPEHTACLPVAADTVAGEAIAEAVAPAPHMPAHRTLLRAGTQIDLPPPTR